MKHRNPEHHRGPQFDRRKWDAKRRESSIPLASVDLAAIRQIPPDPQDLADFLKPPWERHPVPWDNVAPPKQPKIQP